MDDVVILLLLLFIHSSHNRRKKKKKRRRKEKKEEKEEEEKKRKEARRRSLLIYFINYIFMYVLWLLVIYIYDSIYKVYLFIPMDGARKKFVSIENIRVLRLEYFID